MRSGMRLYLWHHVTAQKEFGAFWILDFQIKDPHPILSRGGKASHVSNFKEKKKGDSGGEEKRKDKECEPRKKWLARDYVLNYIMHYI
jgi:hypothetical protein